MPDVQVKKIVYLFGAGATHAELQDLVPDLEQKQLGLLVRDVSSRVIERARSEYKYRKGVETVSGTSGKLNIELLISLIESSKVHDWDYKTRRLKTLVQEDIERILTPSRTRRFYLHKALLDLHKHEQTTVKEQLIGLISLNYDSVLDEAYEELYGPPDYCFSQRKDDSPPQLPLLKLHGSFNWRRQRIRDKWRRIDIIPLGSAKSYLHAPYGFIWNRALEILIECDTLRVIGCSLSPNDAHLIDLLFKAHLWRDIEFEIEIISSTLDGEAIRRNFGFFPRIKTLVDVEGSIADVNPPNPFKTWLKRKSERMLGESTVRATRRLRKL